MRPDSPSEPSSSLLQRARAGTPGRGIGSSRCATPLVGRWCRQYGLQDADVDNVLQDVLGNVWRDLNTFRREQGSVAAWLWTLAHDRIVDQHRRRQQQSEAVGGSAFLEQVNQVPAPMDES